MSSPINLITADDVFEATGQDPALMEQAIGAVDSAISRAMTKLEGVLTSSLQYAAITDTFYVSGSEGSPIHEMYRLRLSQGFVRGTEPLGVYVSETKSRQGPFTRLYEYIVDFDKGVVQVAHEGLLGKAMLVKYTAGFQDGDDVPYPLKHALISYTPLLLLSSSSVANDPEKQASVLSKATSFDSIGADMVARYNRRVGSCYKPLDTVIGPYTL